jgi:hypothetical protein
MTKLVAGIVLSLIGMVLSSWLAFGQGYNVPCGSIGNHLELAVENGSATVTTSVVVKVESTPSWLRIFPSELTFPEILSTKEAVANFAFELDRSAPIGTRDMLTFSVSASGQQWRKTLDVVVTPPERFELMQNFPNPFNPETKIEYSLPKEQLVKLVVYDVLGREVKLLVDEVEEAGYKTVSLNASNLPSGVYFYRLEAGGYIEVKRMLFLK